MAKKAKKAAKSAKPAPKSKPPSRKAPAKAAPWKPKPAPTYATAMPKRPSAAAAAPKAPRPAPARAAAKAAPKGVAKAAPASDKKAPAARAPPKAAPKAAPASDKEALAARMAAFSQKVQTEEETPVAVRSWAEAKAEKPASKQLLPKTGKMSSTEDAEEDIEEIEETVDATEEASETPEETDAEEGEETSEEEPPSPTGEPQMNPLSGPMAVPKDRELEFDVAPRHKIKKVGKGGEKPEEFGPVELRQATASGGRHITRSLPENLQRAAERIQPLATGNEKRGKKKAAPERFEVSMDKRGGPKLPSISDWGDVEIGQQTLSGSRKVGILSPAEQAEQQQRLEEEKKRAKK